MTATDFAKGVTLKVGADPEFFIRVGAHFVSGHHIALGTKAQPQEVLFGAVQNDGLAVEVNIKPCETERQFVDRLTNVMLDLEYIVSNAIPKATVEVKPSVFFGQKYLKKLPEYVSALGCQPDFSAYTKRVNPRPNEESPIRTGSGHVHLGWLAGNGNARSRSHLTDCTTVVKELDYHLGLPSLLWDRDTRRRSLYGRAGAFRPKPYGCEYRTLSNAWLKSPDLMRTVFRRTQLAFHRVAEGQLMASRYGTLAQELIDNNVSDWPVKYPALSQELRL